MGTDLYLSQPFAVAPAYGTQDASCCAAPSSVGAAAASSPQDIRPADAGGLTPLVTPRLSGPPHKACKCWWVAIAAVVVIAVVARSGGGGG